MNELSKNKSRRAIPEGFGRFYENSKELFENEMNIREEMNQDFHDKYPLLANVVNCIVEFPPNRSDKERAEYFDLMQDALIKLQNNTEKASNQ